MMRISTMVMVILFFAEEGRKIEDQVDLFSETTSYDEEEMIDDTWPNMFSMDIFRGWWGYLKLALPSATSLFIEWGSFEVNAIIAASLGTTNLAAHSILSNTTAIWYATSLALSNAASTLIGNSLGANRPEDAKTYTQIVYALVTLYGLLNGLVGQFYAPYLGKLFSDNEDVVKTVELLIPLLWVYHMVDVIKCVGMAALRGVGRPTITVWGNVLSCLLMGYPVALLLVLLGHFGLPGLWTGMSVAWLGCGTLYMIVLIRTDWSNEANVAKERTNEALSTL
eukprot:TRINITY_DN5092_c0_g1_i2.p1 TRINITY_DN5092_c0_g1~~TRINITY_DN5092_c0_g1_i2.p1  ORF type:complete len:281 (-),score=54.83 TRINITY_DN5092_c0_g1_i2:47-889(-)